MARWQLGGDGTELADCLAADPSVCHRCGRSQNSARRARCGSAYFSLLAAFLDTGTTTKARRALWILEWPDSSLGRHFFCQGAIFGSAFWRMDSLIHSPSSRCISVGHLKLHFWHFGQ